MKGAYILVFIRNDANLANFFRYCTIDAKEADIKKNSKVLMRPVIGPSFASAFCWKIAEFWVLMWNNA
jgi:hypothetical protein